MMLPSTYMFKLFIIIIFFTALSAHSCTSTIPFWGALTGLVSYMALKYIFRAIRADLPSFPLFLHINVKIVLFVHIIFKIFQLL